MFEMSVNEVPGWSVLIVPRLIGVPVAATPGLVPHCDVLTVLALELELADAAALDVVPAAALLELELLLLHPASTPPTAMTATAASASRERRREYLFMCSAFSWLTAKYFPNGRRRCLQGKARCLLGWTKSTPFMAKRCFFALPLRY
jgi:hypothetical protein